MRKRKILRASLFGKFNRIGLDFLVDTCTWIGLDQPSTLQPKSYEREKKISTYLYVFFNGPADPYSRI